MKMTAKRLLALALVLIIAVGVISVTAFAADGVAPGSIDFTIPTMTKDSVVSAMSNAPGVDSTLWSVGSTGLVMTSDNGDNEAATNFYVLDGTCTGDWVAEVKVSISPAYNYQQFALLAYENSTNYVKFGYEYNSGHVSDGTHTMFQMAYAAQELDGIDTYSFEKLRNPGVPETFYMRLVKSGNNYYGYYSDNGIDFELAVKTNFESDIISTPALAFGVNNGGITTTIDPVTVTLSYVATGAELAAADAVEKAIADLPESITVETDVPTVSNAYSGLSPFEQKLVNNYDKLKKAEGDYEAAVDAYNQAAADDVDRLIDEIADDVTMSEAEDIAAARVAYNTLLNENVTAAGLVDDVQDLLDAEAAFAVVEKIAAIPGTIDADAKDEINAARTAYNDLLEENEIAAARVGNYDALQTAEVAYVEFLINAIETPVTAEDAEAIETARAAYDACEVKALVGNYQDLLDAEAAYEVAVLIDAIDASITADDKEAIEAARAAYEEDLTADQQALVGNYQDLVDAEAAYEVAVLIDAIPTPVTEESKDEIEAARAAYEEDLTADQQALVGNYKDLTDAETAYKVVALIDAIPTPVTEESKDEIETARAAYDACDVKALVGNYKDLTDAEAAYEVVALINDIGRVTLNSKGEINAARAAYEALTADQKALVSNLSVLEAAEKRYKQLVIYTVLVSGAASGVPFEDVPTNAWYYDAVRDAWENGLIDGMTATEFQPEGSLTVAQAIKLAAALNQMYRYGEVTLENGPYVWYSTYVEYAVRNGIVEADYADLTVTEMNAPVSREEFVHIFYGAMPEVEYGAWNVVLDNNIPDVKLGDDYADEIYTFYRAGILTGSDPYGTFHPESNIRRCEVAAILIRMYDVTARQIVLLG